MRRSQPLPRFLLLAIAAQSPPACSSNRSGAEFADASSGASEASSGSSSNDGSASQDSDSSDTGDDAPRLDVGGLLDVGSGDSCKVGEDGDAIVPCEDQAPPDSFEPELQWSWNAEGAEIYSGVTPLVANLTDDNDDDAIDLCDVPDVVVVSYEDYQVGPAHLHVLDGQSGIEHFDVPDPLHPRTTPALGDIDGDGFVDIVTTGVDFHLVAFDHEGALKWKSANTWSDLSGAIALADLDADGSVEILQGVDVYSGDGLLLWSAAVQVGSHATTTAADLDDDGDLEVVLGNAAFHHDGSVYFPVDPAIPYGFPQVADLDADPEPEILLLNWKGITVLEHDGSVKFAELKPTGAMGGSNWVRPAAIHDLDDDGTPEFLASSGGEYVAYEADATIQWQTPVSDLTGLASGTAFDFLGDGGAEAMYADEREMFVFDDLGGVLLQTPRTSLTLIEYPVVADIDNDGSAEILVVSNESFYNDPISPTVSAIRDKDDRWIQARRIWNQHTYHVTNVREDGTIPTVEPRHWESLNTFRTNAQIEGGATCMPAG